MVSPEEIMQALEAMRAVRDTKTNLGGVKAFRKYLFSDGAAFLKSYLDTSPHFEELCRIWDYQATVKQPELRIPLLKAVKEVLTCDANAYPAVAVAINKLANDVIQSRMKTLYSYLGAERIFVNLTFEVLAAAAARTPALAALVFSNFDFDHKTVQKAAKPPKNVAGLRQKPETDGKKQLPCCSYATMVLNLTATCSRDVRCRLLCNRTVMHTLFQTLPALPAQQVQRLLMVINDYVIQPSAEIPASAQAAAFGDVALAQLTGLLACERDDEDEIIQSVQQLAYDIVLAISTEAAHGMCPTTSDVLGQDISQAGRRQDQGQRRVLRMLHGLQPRSVAVHADLLQAVITAAPIFGGAFLMSCTWMMDPVPTLFWWRGVAVLTRSALQVAPQQAVEAALGQAAAQGRGPPPLQAKSIRTAVTCALPSALSKAVLSQGAQHSSRLVRYVTVCALASMLQGLQPLFDQVQAAVSIARARDQSHESSPSRNHEATWQEWGDRLQALIGSRLPDPQVVWAVLADVEGALSLESDTCGTVGDGPGPGQTEPSGGRSLRSQAHLLWMQVAAVVRGYALCLPTVMAGAHFNAARFLPSDILHHPIVRQQAAVAVMLATVDSMHSRAGSPAASSSEASLKSLPLLPLLHLATGSTSAEVRNDARHLAYLKIRASGATDGCGCTEGEAMLWLCALPMRNAQDPEQAEALGAVISFLAEAVVISSRRPQEALMLVQKHLSVHLLKEVVRAGSGAGFSVLAVVAPQRAQRAAAAASLSSASKAAIADFVGGVLRALVVLQSCPQPLASMLCGIFAQGGGASAKGATLPQGLRHLHELAQQIVADSATLDHDRRPCKRAKTRDDSTNQMTLQDVLSAVCDGRGATSEGCKVSSGAWLLVLRAGAASLLRCQTVADVHACGATISKHLEGCDETEAKMLLGQPALVAAFLGSQRKLVTKARNEAIVAWLALLLPAHPAECQPYIDKMVGMLEPVRGSEPHKLPGELLHACTILHQHLPFDNLLQASVQALRAVSSSGDTGRSATTLAEAAISVIVRQQRQQRLAGDACSGTASAAYDTDGALLALLQAGVSVLVPWSCPLPAVQKLLGRILHQGPHLARQLSPSCAAALVKSSISSRTPAGGFIAAAIASQWEGAVAAGMTSLDKKAGLDQGPDLEQVLCQAGTDPTKSQAAVGVLLPWTIAILQHAKAEASLNTPTAPSPLCSKAAAVTALLQKPMIHYMTHGMRLVTTEGDESGMLQEGQSMLDSCSVAATSLLLQAAPLPADEFQHLLTRLLPERGWAALGNHEGGPYEAAQRISLAAALIFSPLVAQEIRSSAIAQLATCVSATYALSVAKKNAQSLDHQLETQLIRLYKELIATGSVMGCAVDKAVMLRLVAAVSVFTWSVLRHRLRDRVAVIAVAGLIQAVTAASDGCKSARKAAASAASDAFVHLVAHSQFLPLLIAPTDEKLPAVAARMSLPLTSLMPLADIRNEATTKVGSDTSDPTMAVVMLAYRLVAAQGVRPSSASFTRSSLAAVPTLLAAYGATRSPRDVVLLATLKAIDKLASAAPQDELFPSSGPLNDAGYLWGGTAVAAHRAAALNTPRARAAIVKERAPLDPRRIAISCMSDHPAGYDPTWILPFTMAAVRDFGFTVADLVNNGVAALCIKCLSCTDGTLRSQALTVLRLMVTAIEASGEDEDSRDTSSPSGPLLRQLLPLLPALEAATAAGASGSIAAVMALFLAEAVTQLANSLAPLHKRIGKLLSGRPEMDMQELPMFYGELMGGGPQYAADRIWLLRMLIAGLQGEADAAVLRRKFVIERVMPLLHSPIVDSTARWQAVRVVCRAVAVPSCAIDLIASAGLLPWLADATVEATLNAIDARHGHATAGGGSDSAATPASPLAVSTTTDTADTRRETHGHMHHDLHAMHAVMNAPSQPHMQQAITWQESVAVDCLAALEGCLSMAPLQRLLSKGAVASQADSAVRLVITAYIGAIEGQHRALSPAIHESVLRLLLQCHHLRSRATKHNSGRGLLSVMQWASLAKCASLNRQQTAVHSSLLLEALLLTSPEHLFSDLISTAEAPSNIALCIDVALWAVTAASENVPARWCHLLLAAGLSSDSKAREGLPTESIEPEEHPSETVLTALKLIQWLSRAFQQMTGPARQSCIQGLATAVAVLQGVLPPALISHSTAACFRFFADDLRDAQC